MKTRRYSAATALLLLLCATAGSNPAERKISKRRIEANPEKVILEEIVIGKDRQIEGCAIAEDASMINDQILSLLADQERSNAKLEARGDQQADQSVIINLSDVRDLEDLERAFSVVDYEPQKLAARKKKRKTVSGDLSDPIVVKNEPVETAAAEDYETAYYEVQRNPHPRARTQDPVAGKLYSRLLESDELPVSVIKKRPNYTAAKAVGYVHETTIPVKKVRGKSTKSRVQSHPENLQEVLDNSPGRPQQGPASGARRTKQSFESIETTTAVSNDPYSPRPGKRRTRKRVNPSGKPRADEGSSAGNLQASDSNAYALSTHETSALGERQDESTRVQPSVKYDAQPRLLTKYDVQHRPLVKYKVQPRPFALRDNHEDVPQATDLAEKIYKEKKPISEIINRAEFDTVKFIREPRLSVNDVPLRIKGKDLNPSESYNEDIDRVSEQTGQGNTYRVIEEEPTEESSRLRSDFRVTTTARESEKTNPSESYGEPTVETGAFNSDLRMSKARTATGESEERDPSESYREVEPVNVPERLPSPGLTHGSFSSAPYPVTGPGAAPMIAADQRRSDAYTGDAREIQSNPTGRRERVRVTDAAGSTGLSTDANRRSELKANDEVFAESVQGDEYRDERNAEGGTDDSYPSESSHEVDGAGQGAKGGGESGGAQGKNGAEHGEGGAGDGGVKQSV